MIKAIITDLDGTIALPNNTLSNKTVNIFSKLDQDECKIIIATGRSYIDTYQLTNKYSEFKSYKVMLSGGLTLDRNNNVISFNKISSYKLSKIIDIVKPYRSTIGFYDQRYIYSCKEIDNLKFFSEYIHLFTDYENKTDNNLQRSLITINTIKELRDLVVLKVEIIEKNKDKFSEVFEKLKSIGLECTTSGYDNIEVTNGGINKGLSLLNLLSALNIDEDECLVFGDSENDISMFQHFTNTIAVENAVEELKKLAKHICDSCSNDGVANYLEDYINKSAD
ncbi:MAG: Cof-type HAD-IIB family hydrolase [Anaerorhabdus sp.]|jgi:5-amino-6-(5-phospho-D-ribitylamino)uracil phosphatase